MPDVVNENPKRVERGSAATIARRGSVLILVVGVLVLLAIAATVYVGVGRQERISAAAQETSSSQKEVVNKIVEYLGQILTDDLYATGAGSGEADRPFEDGTEARPFYRVGERWDYPMTFASDQPSDDIYFNVLADAWLASTEPEDTNRDGRPDLWRHISNIHPQGRYVDLHKFFEDDMFRRVSIYGPMEITGPDSRPYQLDTMNPEMDFSKQLDDLDPNDGIDGYPTMADQRYGTDTDGDGRIDARWTELLDVLGLPQGMRIFTAIRVVDASGLINLNTSIETGATRDDDDGPNVGFPRYPTDIDLYTLLWDDYEELAKQRGGQALERNFSGGIPGREPGAMRSHLGWMGVLAHTRSPQALDYNFYQRLDAYSQDGNRRGREDLYPFMLANPNRPFESYRPYGTETLFELLTYRGMSNDLITSRLEQNFDVLNDGGLSTISPFRNNEPYEVDYSLDAPSIQENFAVRSARTMLTTYNGQRNVMPYNSPDPSTTIQIKPNINDLLKPENQNENVDLQSVFSGYMWALAPYAVDHDRDRNGNYLGKNIFGEVATWEGTTDLLTNYGAGHADFAFGRAGMMAVNTLDAYDKDNDPSIRVLRYEQLDEAARDHETELSGTFDFGRMHADGVDTRKNMVLIGTEKQPFFREASHVQVWAGHRDLNDPNLWIIKPSEDLDINGIPDSLAFELVGFEIGNPWDEPIDLSRYEVMIGTKSGTDEVISLAGLGDPILDPGEVTVVGRWAAQYSDSIGNQLARNWADVVEGRGGGVTPVNLVRSDTMLLLETPTDAHLTLWRTNAPLKQGTNLTRVLVDRMSVEESAVNFPGALVNDLSYEPVNEEPPGLAAVFDSSIRRSVLRPDGDSPSFPPYVLQSDKEVAANGFDDKVTSIEGTNINADYLPPSTVFSDDETRLIDRFNTPEGDNKGYPPDYGTTFYDRFQLHVWNDEDIKSPYDLLMVTSVTSLYVPQDWGTFNIQNDLSNPDNQRRYITLSEMLGDEDLFATLNDRRWQGDGGMTPEQAQVLYPSEPTPNFDPSGYDPPDCRLVLYGKSDVNPFIGKLDYTRYIPGRRHQNIPLACRVVDAFDVNSPITPNGLVQGRININTAPLRVLEALPYLHPRFKAGKIPARTPNVRFAEAVKAYRDREVVRVKNTFGLDWDDREAASQLNRYESLGEGSRGLRQSRGNAGERELTWQAGFTSLGELALITQWTAIGGSGGDSGYQQTHRPPAYGNIVLQNMSLTAAGHSPGNLDYPPLNPDPKATEQTPENDPTNDVTEWLGIPRAISDVISLRSDVFIAYIRVVGFTPADVQEAIQKKQDGTVSDALAALTPTMEQRYVVVFDRSNVNDPNDRPRLLFAAQRVPIR